MQQHVRQLESNYLRIPLSVPRKDFRPFSHSSLNIKGSMHGDYKAWHDMFSLPHRDLSSTWTKRFSMAFLVQKQQRNMLHLALSSHCLMLGSNMYKAKSNSLQNALTSLSSWKSFYASLQGALSNWIITEEKDGRSKGEKLVEITYHKRYVGGFF